jgi:peroxiredoxin/uncharacterized membrane protein YphA (DoxX/SURF4 family)
MAAAVVVIRLALAAVFAFAGAAKLADPAGSRRAIRDFGIPERLAAPLAFLLPVAEIGIAVGLVPASSVRLAAGAGAGLLVLFAVAISIALLRGRRPDCHCFGQLHSAPAGPATLVRNLALAGLAVLIASQPAGDPGWIELAAVGVAMVVGGQAALSYLLMRRYGRALLRIQELETGLSRPETLALGAEAPDFALPDLDGHEVELGGLLAGKRPVLLVFADPGCGPCRALLPQLAVWQNDHADRFTLALVSRGEQSENTAVAEEHGLHTVLIQEDREVADLYQSDATPSAALVGAEGRIEHPLVTGADAITELVDFATSPSRAVALAGNGARRIAVAAALAGGLGVAATEAGASTTEETLSSVVDPKLAAIGNTIRKATPKLQRDENAIRQALVANASKPGARSNAAVRESLRTLRADVLDVRARVIGLSTTKSPRAAEAKQLCSKSFQSLAEGLERFEQIVVAAPAQDVTRLSSQSRKLFAIARSYGYAANLVLGCKGKGC